jgi:hypothetical protein
MSFGYGNNFLTITFYPIILIDFVLDIVVLGVHGRDLKWFYICGYVFTLYFFLYYSILIIFLFLHVYNHSFVFLLVPILLKMLISWFILNDMSQNDNLWRTNHPRTVITFKLLSWVDLEALNVVTSGCAGIKALSVKITEETQERIDDSIVTIAFIEDVPQLIIYALYQRYTVIPAIIPILVLSSACIAFLFKIHDRNMLRVEKTPIHKRLIIYLSLLLVVVVVAVVMMKVIR